MAQVSDVAEYILQRLGPTTTMKLQKLVYYCQAWSLVWDEKPLFPEEIQAWANGPVVPALYERHRGFFEAQLGEIGGDPAKIEPEQAETIDAVLEYYGNKPAQWLIDLTHMEDPWREARGDLPETARSTQVIELTSIADYYSSLQ